VASVTKICNKCKEERPEKEFPKNGKYRRGSCRDCWAVIKRKWVKANPEKVKAQKQRTYHRHKERINRTIAKWRKKNPEYDARRFLKSKFNMTLEDYNEMLECQDNVCAICKQPEMGSRAKRLAVDHCHVTDMNRGLLCQRCNRALGLFQDDVEVLQNAVEYLSKFQPNLT
jgi:hypothetical protein